MSIWTPESKADNTWTPKGKEDATWTPESNFKEIVFDSSYSESLKFKEIVLNNNSDRILNVKSVNFGTIWTRQFEIVNPYITKTNEYKGALTTHTLNSDGVDTPTALETAYKNAGYDFIAITDHDFLTTDPNVSGILHINGVEETANEGHIISIGVNNQTNLTSAQNIIDYINGENALPSMAHPNTSGVLSWTDSELESIYGYWSIEIYNDLVGIKNAENKWDTLLTKNIRSSGIAVDDCHNIAGENFNKGWVIIFADNLILSEITNALKKGNFYSSTGATLSIVVSGKIITVTTDSSSTIKWIGSGGNTLRSTTNVTSDSYTVNGNEVYVRIKITRNSDNKNAWSNPIYII